MTVKDILREFGISRVTLAKYCQRLNGHQKITFLLPHEVNSLRDFYVKERQEIESKVKTRGISLVDHVKASVLADSLNMNATTLGIICKKNDIHANLGAGGSFYHNDDLKAIKEAVYRYKNKKKEVVKKDSKYNNNESYLETDFKESVKIDGEELGSLFFKQIGAFIENINRIEKAKKLGGDYQLLSKCIADNVCMIRMVINKIPLCTARNEIIKFYKLEDWFNDVETFGMHHKKNLKRG